MTDNNEVKKSNSSKMGKLFMSLPIILVAFFFLGSSTTTKHCENCDSQRQKVSRGFGLSETDIVLRAGKHDCEHKWQSAGSTVEVKKQG